MKDALRRHLASLAIVMGCAGGMIGWVGIAVARTDFEVYRQDWIVYDAAGAAARAGLIDLLYDSRRFTAFQYETLAPWFAGPPSLHPWLYPPPFLLLLAPLSRLPFAAAFAAFVIPTLAAALVALAWRGIGKGWNWPRAAMLLFFPVTLINALTGQNAFLSAALMIGGVRLLERWESVGGAVLGLLIYKPQLYVLVPVALAAARAWRGLAASLLSAAALVAASAAAFGVPAWLLWFERIVRAGDPAVAAWLGDTFLHGYSLYVAAKLLGLPDAAAGAVQAAGALAAAAAVLQVFRGERAGDARLAVLLAAAIVATPHLQAYEMVLLAAAVILLWPQDRRGIGLGAFALFGGVWLLPFLRPFSGLGGRLAVPAVLAALLAAAVVQATRQRWQSTPSPAPALMSSGRRKSR
jgi:hypothetical protein